MKNKYDPHMGIKDYDNDYYVNDRGEVFSEKHGTMKLLKQSNHKGYLRVNLSKNNKRKQFFVHRLVAEAFIPNPFKKSQVNHKDGNKENNHITNLEWVTREENEAHKRKILGWDNKEEKNGNCGYNMAKCFPSPELRNKLVEIGIPRWKHNLAELGEMLPKDIKVKEEMRDKRFKQVYNFYDLKIEKTGNEWDIVYGEHTNDGWINFMDEIYAKTEADARAKMLVYLAENNLLTPKSN